MATSGTVNTGYRNGTRFYLSWGISSQDVTNNRSLISWEIGVQGTSGQTSYWYSNAIRINSGYIGGQKVSGSATYSNITLSGSSKHKLRSGSVWIYHNSDGGKDINVSISGWFFGYGDISSSNSWALTTIPRNSQVSTDKSSYTLGEPIQIITNRKSSSFTHTITIRLNNSGGTIIKTINSVGSSTTWTPTSDEIEQMQDAIPSSNTLTLYINQYNNQVKANSNVSRVLTLTEANPTFTDFEYEDSNANVVAITGNNQILVKGKSTLETTISVANKMVAIKGASEDHYTVAYDGVTEQDAYSADSDIVNTFTPNTIGNRTIIATAFDSRGNNTSVTKTVTVYDYNAPTISTTLTRENNFGSDTTVHIEGTFDPLTIGGVEKNELTTGSLEYRYQEEGGSFGSWTEVTFTPGSGTFTTDDFVLDLNNQKRFNFEFRVSDKFGQVTSTNFVDVGNPIMFVGQNDGEAAVSIGSMPVDGARLTIDGENFIVDEDDMSSDSATRVPSQQSVKAYIGSKMPIMFCARKTANQTTGTSGNLTTITWSSVDEFGDTGNFSSSQWTAPADGWLECQALLQIDGGADADDTMNWGFYKNGSIELRHLDNWRKFSTASGVEYPTVAVGAFFVSEGDVIDIRFAGVQNNVTILGSSNDPCVFMGRFTPSIS